MGTATFDGNTKEHFLMGVLCFFLVDHYDISTKTNFWASNGVHLLIELQEKNKAPDGRVLETSQNRIADVVGFLAGWALAYSTGYKAGPVVAFVCGVMVSVTAIDEVQREQFPYNCTWQQKKGAFM